ncbi:MAG: DUF1592 domain-containing protein [Planctomycetota bacterium]|nr:DUF1592 domain-containing protein [Planctomycetota bacterium]
MDRPCLLTNARVSAGAILLAAIALLVCWRGISEPEAPAQDRPARRDSQGDYAQAFTTGVRPLLEKYCFSCHGPDEQNEEVRVDLATGGITIRENRQMWERVFQMVKFGSMPPEDESQPSPEEREQIVSWLDQALNFLDCDQRYDPGRVTVRRLNRLEYHNSIRDLFGVDLNPTKDFPSDDVGDGFDNIGDVLSLPPLLFEKYMDAAEDVSRSVIVAVNQADPKKQVIPAGQLVLEGAAKPAGDTILMPSRGTVTATIAATSKGHYQVLVTAGAQQAGDEVARLDISIDNKKAGVLEIPASHRKMEEYMLEVMVAKGEHRISATFSNDYYNPDDPDPANRDRNMYIRSLGWRGPTRIDAGELPPSHRRIVTAHPDEQRDVAGAASQVLAPLMRRAFRRPVPDDQVNQYAGLVQFAVDQEESYERGLQVAISAILVSPQFLFRSEGGDGADDPSRVQLVDDLSLASRLSFFLWSSIPDDQLLELAERRQLRKTGVLREQIKRMLADPRADSLVDAFATQWLNLRNLELASPDPDLFPFDDQLRSDMQQETEMFFASVMRDNRPVTDFLDGRFTFLNERLARHYGIDGVVGEQFQRVSLEGLPRAGILTQASILTITSDPTRTSPVKRGKWIMENILGTPPPDPPADVPEIETTQKALPAASFREQLELHRTKPICASCHQHMDPLGFGFENFDAIGRWRQVDGEFPIDSSGTLPGGEKFDGPIELIEILREREKDFVRSFTEKMLVFALGRGLRYYDQCAVEDIIKVLPSREYRFSAIVEQIVLSDPFRKRRGDGGKE